MFTHRPQAKTATMESEMAIEMLPAIPGSVHCLHCVDGGAHESLFMTRLLAVGFGDCSVTKGDECVYSESGVDEDGYWTAQSAEDAAAADPEHDWRVSFYAPLYDAVYQRQGEKHWVLVKKGMGFA